MVRAGLLAASLAFSALSCGDSTAPRPLEDRYTLVAENDQPLPSNPGAPAGSVSADQDTVTLLYGDEGPGSNQIRATFRR